jgi:hypothetical protein
MPPLDAAAEQRQTSAMSLPQIVLQILPLVVIAALLVFIKSKLPWNFFIGLGLLIFCTFELTARIFGTKGTSALFGFAIIMGYTLALALLGQNSAHRPPRLTERLYALEAKLARLTAAPLPEGQVAFAVTLEAYPADRTLVVIKVVREITGLSLKDAKELVEGAPSVLKQGISKADAERSSNSSTRPAPRW